ncbi:restriction endonuclease subunit S [Enterococcus faecium]|uniref:restriction endonuclease subunit S n=1 Tax=Enterococcus faecium TaxID=1352 RepID=UPI00190E9932|nr:restriction endonuclease subunit S [Enterococcus faecium]
MSKKSPQLRFEGFTDDWEEHKFKDILKTHSFRSYLAGVSENGEYEVIQQGDKPIVGYSDGEPFTDYKDITLFGDHTVSLYKPKSPFFVATDGVKILSADNFEGDYLYTTLERYKPEPQGYKRHFTILKNQDVWFTENMEEQQKIGVFFKQLDDTITLHQRKLDLLKEQKKGYLQKMFPKNGAKVPELRFAGFADDWEERKSKELCTISTGKGNTQDKVDDGAYPFYVRSATIEKSDEYLYDQEAVLTVGDGVGTGKVYHYVNGKYNLHQRVYRMYDFKDVSAKYFYYYFSKNFYKRVMSMTAKTSVDSVRMEMIADMNIVFPSVKEQENIVELFSNLDNTIALHQRKLDLLKEQKKGFLQKMFV